MKQPEDTKTIDLLDQVKRGRGRPRVENPLTPAERAKRYRVNQRKKKHLMLDIRDTKLVSEKQLPWHSQDPSEAAIHEFRSLQLQEENDRLKAELEMRDARSESDEVWMLKLKIQQLENDLQSYRQLWEQRREMDDHAQRQFGELYQECDQLRQENQQLRSQLENRDAETVTENNDALYWEEMYKAEAARVDELEELLATGKRPWKYADSLLNDAAQRLK